MDPWARGNFAATVEIWRLLAVNGDADTKFRVGRGVPVDPALASDWFRTAAA